MVIQVQLTIEFGDREFLLTDLTKEVQDFLVEKDCEIISCLKVRNNQKRPKDV